MRMTIMLSVLCDACNHKLIIILTNSLSKSCEIRNNNIDFLFCEFAYRVSTKHKKYVLGINNKLIIIILQI